jgi:hypothetical protein
MLPLDIQMHWMHLEKPDLDRFLQMREDYEAMFRLIISNGIEAGEFKNYNHEIIVFSMLSTLRTLYLWYGRKPGFTTLNLRKNLSKILLEGII